MAGEAKKLDPLGGVMKSEIENGSGAKEGVAPVLYRSIVWMSGLIEGEGCVSWNETPQIQIAMSDQDVIAHAASVFKANIRGPYDKGPGCKPQWLTSVGGAKAAGWLMTLYPLLGERRRAKAREVLAKWRTWGQTRGKYADACKRGHNFSEHGYRDGRGYRQCTVCQKQRYALWYSRKKSSRGLITQANRKVG